MRTPLIAILLIGTFFHVKAQVALLSLPDSLVSNANEVVLNDHTTFEIIDLSKSKLSRTYEAWVLNAKGEDLSRVYLNYNDFRKIANAEIFIYNLFGKEVEHIKLKDFEDYSTKGYSIATDSRAKYYKYVPTSYPYKIKVSYSIDYEGSMFYPAWRAQSDEHQSVIQSTLQVICPDEHSFRHKSNITPELTEDTPGKTTFIWKVKQLKPFELENFSSTMEDYTPVVYTAPNQFTMDGFEGDLSTWEHFGEWINQLNRSQNTLTESNKQDFLQKIPTEASTYEKIKATYEYLQNNTRYVSIQLGIGGWQPFSSGFVHDNKYGDCKALSFYTKCLLETLGIQSYYTLINAGKRAPKTDPNFPEARFNHAILTVPVEKDTIWLECTSQTNPFGYMGSFTGSRNALMITENGAKIIKTKNYTPSDNTQQTIAKVEISPSGAATAKIKRTFSGMEIENNYVSSAALKSPTEQQKWFYDNHNWGNLSVTNLEISDPSLQTVPLLEMNVTANFDKIATFSSNRLFYKPFLFTNLLGMKLPNTDRKQSMEIRYPYTQRDTIKATFPEGFYPEKKLKEVHLTNEFGEYHLELSQDGNNFLFVRTFILLSGTHKADEYESFRNFIKSVQKNDKAKLVMLNKT